MQAWWEAMSAFEKVFACIAIPSTLVLLVQTILSLIGIGGGADADTDADLDGDGIPDGDSLDLDGDGVADSVLGGGFHFISARGIIAFLTVMGWTGYVMLKSGVPEVVSIIVAVTAGLAIMALISLILYEVSKLQSSGNIVIKNAIGKSGTVYINVPAKRDGFGKVNVVVQEKLCEFEAVTDEEEVLKFGQEVVVIGVSGLNTLVVKKK